LPPAIERARHESAVRAARTIATEQARQRAALERPPSPQTQYAEAVYELRRAELHRLAVEQRALTSVASHIFGRHRKPQDAFVAAHFAQAAPPDPQFRPAPPKSAQTVAGAPPTVISRPTPTSVTAGPPPRTTDEDIYPVITPAVTMRLLEGVAAELPSPRATVGRAPSFGPTRLPSIGRRKAAFSPRGPDRVLRAFFDSGTVAM
jgi:hypothetical protein